LKQGTAESKLKGVALRIWPLNSTANGRNFGANRANGARRRRQQAVSWCNYKENAVSRRQKGTGEAVQKAPIKNAAPIAYMAL